MFMNPFFQTLNVKHVAIRTIQFGHLLFIIIFIINETNRTTFFRILSFIIFPSKLININIISCELKFCLNSVAESYAAKRIRKKTIKDNGNKEYEAQSHNKADIDNYNHP